MGADALAGSALQSGFVFAIIIAAVLFANYLGGDAGLAQRAAQVGLGLVLAMLVFSATAAFHETSTVSPTDLDAFFSSEEHIVELANETAKSTSELGSIHIGLGIIFVVLGVALFRRLQVITPAILLAGVLLILFGTPSGGPPTDQLSALTGLLGGIVTGNLGDAEGSRDIARFVVLLVGFLVLAGVMYFRWERRAVEDAGESENA